MDRKTADLLAALFAYPDEGYAVAVREARDHLIAQGGTRPPSAAWSESMRPHTPAGGPFMRAAARLDGFLALLPTDVQAQRELFLRSFDVQSVTTLDVGYALFGDDYKRGELLANLSREQRTAGNDCGHELADHLPNVLRLLPRLGDAALRDELVREILAPALRRMIAEFEVKRLLVKDDLYRRHHKTLIAQPRAERTAYRLTLEAVLDVLGTDHDLPERAAAGLGSDFIQSVQLELKEP